MYRNLVSGISYNFTKRKRFKIENITNFDIIINNKNDN